LIAGAIESQAKAVAFRPSWAGTSLITKAIGRFLTAHNDPNHHPTMDLSAHETAFGFFNSGIQQV
jgi:hypothetical protein